MNMFKKVTIALFLVPLIVACSKQLPEPQSITVRFHPYVGEQPLVFNEYLYSNPGGDGEFKIRDFQLYISNIRLSGEGSEHRIPDSYHLVRFDNDTGYYDLSFNIPQPNQYSQITFGVGVDAKANGSIMIVGDLDPNSRMAWSWDVGYKFILLEGLLNTPDDSVPLVYHVGFDENYKEVSLPINMVNTTNESQVKPFRVDILSLFTGQGPMDLANTSSVKFDEQDARQVAAGFDSLIKTCDKLCS